MQSRDPLNHVIQPNTPYSNRSSYSIKDALREVGVNQSVTFLDDAAIGQDLYFRLPNEGVLPALFPAGEYGRYPGAHAHFLRFVGQISASDIRLLREVLF